VSASCCSRSRPVVGAIGSGRSHPPASDIANQHTRRMRRELFKGDRCGTLDRRRPQGLSPAHIARFLGRGNRLISKVRVRPLDRARDTIDLVGGHGGRPFADRKRRNLRRRSRRRLGADAPGRFHRKRREDCEPTKSIRYTPWLFSLCHHMQRLWPYRSGFVLTRSALQHGGRLAPFSPALACVWRHQLPCSDQTMVAISWKLSLGLLGKSFSGSP
jgi:hypothetical protein